jgi:hypothetical protein
MKRKTVRKCADIEFVIASEAKRRKRLSTDCNVYGLLRRDAPRNDKFFIQFETRSTENLCRYEAAEWGK